MNTLLISHQDCLKHNPGNKHPECRERLSAVLEAVRKLPGLMEFKAPMATEDQLSLVHPRAYWESIISNEPDYDLAQLDPDTLMSPGSAAAILRGAGAPCMAVDQLLNGKAANAFCAVRPPGHHAEAEKAMGFCLFNNVAIGAAYALSQPGINRVAIIDFDVHHGNGTQAIFEDAPAVIYISTHQQPLYPGTGHPDEKGINNIYNLVLEPDSGGLEMNTLFNEQLLPTLRSARPDMIFISAGFDAHENDPLAQLNLSSQDYYWMTKSICDVAEDSCSGKVISILEGGYNLEALAESARWHVQALLDAGDRKSI